MLHGSSKKVVSSLSSLSVFCQCIWINPNFSTDACSMFIPGKWIEYDDDNPIPQREEDITKLSGGGKLTWMKWTCVVEKFSILFLAYFPCDIPVSNCHSIHKEKNCFYYSFSKYFYPLIFRWLAYGIHLYVQGTSFPSVIFVIPSSFRFKSPQDFFVDPDCEVDNRVLQNWICCTLEVVLSMCYDHLQ